MEGAIHGGAWSETKNAKVFGRTEDCGWIGNRNDSIVSHICLWCDCNLEPEGILGLSVKSPYPVALRRKGTSMMHYS